MYNKYKIFDFLQKCDFKMYSKIRQIALGTLRNKVIFNIGIKYIIVINSDSFDKCAKKKVTKCEKRLKIT